MASDNINMLEARSDALLAEAGASDDEEYPAHPDRYFRKQDRDNGVEQLAEDSAVSLRGAALSNAVRGAYRNAMVAAACHAAAHKMLTPAQTECFLDRMAGWSYGEIKERRGIPIRTSKRHAATAIGMVKTLLLSDYARQESRIEIDRFDLWHMMLEVFGARLLGMAGYLNPKKG